jgi:hypothetical protein
MPLLGGGADRAGYSPHSGRHRAGTGHLVAAAVQAHLIEEHKADPERTAAQSTFTNSLKLLWQARERLGQGLRAVEAGNIAKSDEISLRNQ